MFIHAKSAIERNLITPSLKREQGKDVTFIANEKIKVINIQTIFQHARFHRAWSVNFMRKSYNACLLLLSLCIFIKR